MRSRVIFGALVLFFAYAFLWPQEKPKQELPAGAPAAETPAAPHPAKISPEDVVRKNPVKFTDVSVERGKKLYTSQCSLCHGDKGDGKSDLAQEMKITPPDFSKPETLEKRTDGELFAIMGVGSGSNMPGQGTRMIERQKWYLVNYLRALSGKTPAKATGKEPEDNVIFIQEKQKP